MELNWLVAHMTDQLMGASLSTLTRPLRSPPLSSRHPEGTPAGWGRQIEEASSTGWTGAVVVVDFKTTGNIQVTPQGAS